MSVHRSLSALPHIQLALFLTCATSASCTCSSSSSSPAGSPPAVSVVPSKPSYAQNEQVVLNVTVANLGTAPCEILNQPEGSITVVDLQRDGATVTPTLGEAEYLNGFHAAEAQGFVMVQPGQSTTFPWAARRPTSTKPHTIDTRTEGTGELADVTRFPVDVPGHYTMTIRYGTPMSGAAPADACSIAAVATAEFTVEGATP